MSELIVGAGAFCDVEPCFARLNGVIKTRIGYADVGLPAFPDPIQVVFIIYDSNVISFSELTDMFFMIHDPTSPNRQGHHRGFQFSSVLFYSNPTEQVKIMSKIHQLTPYFSDPIRTLVADKGRCQFTYARQNKCDWKSVSDRARINMEHFLQRKLTHEQYWIMRGKGTESPFSGVHIYTDTAGVYTCAACGQKLFLSKSKFSSGSGWPAFDSALPKSVVIQKDFSHFMIRDEVLCSRCCSHLGHVFNDGPTQTGLRYCINSLALNFKENPKISKSPK